MDEKKRDEIALFRFGVTLQRNIVFAPRASFFYEINKLDDSELGSSKQAG